MGVPTGMKEENIKAFFIFVIAWFLISMITHINSVYIYSYSSVTVQSLSHVQFFVTPWTAACQDSLSITNSWSLLKLMSIESVIPSSHLVLCHPLLLLLSIFPSIRVFSNESTLHIKWPKCWSFSFSISPSREEKDRITMTFQCY